MVSGGREIFAGELGKVDKVRQNDSGSCVLPILEGHWQNGIDAAQKIKGNYGWGEIMISRDVMVTNKTGMHARPASDFAAVAGKFKSNITVYNKAGKKANGKSLINILVLGITKDSTITITAEGEDEAEAIEHLVKLVESKFGEE